MAFRPPTPISYADGNGASFQHSIGRVDAVWTAIGAVYHLDEGSHGVVKLWLLVVRNLK